MFRPNNGNVCVQLRCGVVLILESGRQTQHHGIFAIKASRHFPTLPAPALPGDHPTQLQVSQLLSSYRTHNIPPDHQHPFDHCHACVRSPHTHTQKDIPIFSEARSAPDISLFCSTVLTLRRALSQPHGHAPAWRPPSARQGRPTHRAEPVGDGLERVAAARDVDDDGGEEDGQHDDDHVEAVVQTCKQREQCRKGTVNGLSNRRMRTILFSCGSEPLGST